MMANDDLMGLIDHGHRLLERERALFFRGDFTHVAELIAAKEELLARFESAVSTAVPTPALRTALDRLIAESRRNEDLIAAARRGVLAARRRIEAIAATRKGDVAYAPDGTRIRSEADASEKTSRA